MAKHLMALCKSPVESFISRAGLTTAQALVLKALCDDCMAGRLSTNVRAVSLSSPQLNSGAVQDMRYMRAVAYGGRPASPMTTVIGDHQSIITLTSISLQVSAGKTYAQVELQNQSTPRSGDNPCLQLHQLQVVSTDGSLSISKEICPSLKVPSGGHIVVRLCVPVFVDGDRPELVKATWLCSI